MSPSIKALFVACYRLVCISSSKCECLVIYVCECFEFTHNIVSERSNDLNQLSGLAVDSAEPDIETRFPILT